MRIRNLKPRLWRSDDFTSLDNPWDRLLFIALWSYVDDNGVGIDSATEIVADCFAADLRRSGPKVIDNVERGLAALTEKGMLARYDGVALDRPGKLVPLLYLTGWKYHQKVYKPNKPRFSTPSNEVTPVIALLTNEETCVITLPDGVPVEVHLTDTKPAGDSTLLKVPDEIHGNFQTHPGTVSGKWKVVSGKWKVVSGSSADADSRFEDFWKNYPRKTEKQAALRKWHQVFVDDPDLDPQRVIDAAMAYRNDPNRSDKYTKLPTTWLNKGCWDDVYSSGREGDPF